MKKREEFAIIDTLLKNPGIYLDELGLELTRSTGATASTSTLYRTIRRLGFTRKKMRYVSMQQDAIRREEFMDEMKYINSDMIVWLDETGSDRRNAKRRFGYHLRGMTPTDYKFAIRGKRYSSIAVMSHRGLEDFDTYEGSVNGDTFCDFIERCVIPILQPFNGTNSRSIVVMDNASIHHIEKVTTTILASGAIIRFLPPYSPDYNPLEESFAKVKDFLKASHIVYDTTLTPQLLIAMGFNSISTQDCHGYIKHAGYQLS